MCESNVIPPALQVLYNACKNLYPDQTNPLQVSALVKYWLGGPDPLDYISMYSHPGDPKLRIPPHWHYISFGFSDIHGDGRVHEQTGPSTPSGFGFELTLRLKREKEETSPPTWPAAVMQSLAKYVFQSESTVCVGDHVSWHSPLDSSESRVQHMLMANDPCLSEVMTPNGAVQFIQIVGVTVEELKAAQHWNGCGVLEIMRQHPETGGLWLLTDMRRGESICEVDPNFSEIVEKGIEEDGSNLSGVSARISWTTGKSDISYPASQGSLDHEQGLPSDVPSPAGISKIESEQIKSTLLKGLQTSASNSSSNSEYNECGGDSVAELFTLCRLESLHLTINLESGCLLPLALRGRLKHGRHFTFKSVMGNNAVTFVSPNVAGAFVDAANPYAARGPWLQVLIHETFLDEMSSALAPLSNPDDVPLPATYSWPEKNLKITIVDEN